MTNFPGAPARKPAAAAAAAEAVSDAERSDGPGGIVAQARDYLQQHPVAATVIAAGVGVLLQTALAAATRAGGRSGRGSNRVVARPGGAAAAGPAGGRSHDTGAAAMEFRSQHPDGKKVSFKFSWKKRPVELADADWPVDQMGFTASRPDGKKTVFQFTRKTRRVPEGYGVSSADSCRPGLGEANMEFVASRPGRRDFRFTWNKQPPARPGKLSSADGPGAGQLAPTLAKRSGQKASKTSDGG